MQQPPTDAPVSTSSGTMDLSSSPTGGPLPAGAGEGVPTPEAGRGVGRREYRCTFMAAGRVKQADQKQSEWLIPASSIAAAQAQFDGRPVYLDHPDLYGFGCVGTPLHQEPKVSRLVGITFGAQWSDAEQAMTGNIRLYDRAEGSPGWLVGKLFDQILEDQAAGRDVP
ncbi:MAG: hypothetical protein MUE60_13115, partial [Candidatus Eisenbacteria bacterium]|nr:hypothetical protein [Candidatus Eisenbacteria bacterium]